MKLLQFLVASFFLTLLLSGCRDEKIDTFTYGTFYISDNELETYPTSHDTQDIIYFTIDNTDHDVEITGYEINTFYNGALGASDTIPLVSKNIETTGLTTLPETIDHRWLTDTLLQEMGISSNAALFQDGDRMYLDIFLLYSNGDKRRAGEFVTIKFVDNITGTYSNKETCGYNSPSEEHYMYTLPFNFIIEGDNFKRYRVYTIDPATPYDPDDFFYITLEENNRLKVHETWMGTPQTILGDAAQVLACDGPSGASSLPGNIPTSFCGGTFCENSNNIESSESEINIKLTYGYRDLSSGEVNGVYFHVIKN